MTDRHEFMDIQTLMEIVGVEEERDIRYLPLPNTVDVVISEILAPDYLTPTAFAFAFFENGDVLLANNRRHEIETQDETDGSGTLEVPGGHRDPTQGGKLEDPATTAKRECFEETGAVLDDVTPVGFMRAETEGPKPENYKYPYPISCQQFFCGIISATTEFMVTEECYQPVRLTHDDAEASLSGRTLALYRAAREALFPSATPTAEPAP